MKGGRGLCVCGCEADHQGHRYALRWGTFIWGVSSSLDQGWARTAWVCIGLVLPKGHRVLHPCPSARMAHTAKHPGDVAVTGARPGEGLFVCVFILYPNCSSSHSPVLLWSSKLHTSVCLSGSLLSVSTNILSLCNTQRYGYNVQASAMQRYTRLCKSALLISPGAMTH